MATLDQIAGNGANLSIPIYVKRAVITENGNGAQEAVSLTAVWDK